MGILEFISENKADILSILGIAGFGLSEMCLADASQKYYRDGDGKVYILPVIGSAASAGLIFMSGAEHHKKEALLSGAVAALTAENLKQRKALEKKMSDEELYSLDKEEEDKYNESVDGEYDGREIYWLRQFGIRFRANDTIIKSAENHTNKDFQENGSISLDDILGYLGADNWINTEKAKNIIWTVNYTSDEQQGFIFVTNKVKIGGDIVNELHIIRVGGDELAFD